MNKLPECTCGNKVWKYLGFMVNSKKSRYECLDCQEVIEVEYKAKEKESFERCQNCHTPLIDKLDFKMKSEGVALCTICLTTNTNDVLCKQCGEILIDNICMNCGK